jgi:hypothetical protein
LKKLRTHDVEKIKGERNSPLPNPKFTNLARLVSRKYNAITSDFGRKGILFGIMTKKD